MMLLSCRLSEISMPAKTMRRRRLEGSNRLSILSPRALSSMFVSFPGEIESRRARPTRGSNALARQKPGWFVARGGVGTSAGRRRTLRTSHDAPCGTVSTCRLVAADLCHLGPRFEFFGRVVFGVSKRLKPVGCRTAGGFVCHRIVLNVRVILGPSSRDDVRSKLCGKIPHLLASLCDALRSHQCRPWSLVLLLGQGCQSPNGPAVSSFAR
jgi:hypothetical protein